MKRLKLFLANVGRRHALYPLATPPMGIMSLAAYLRTKFDLEIRLVNQRADNISYEELAKQVVDFAPDVVGFGTLTPFGYALGPLTRAVRDAFPEALILLGGPHSSSFRAKILEDTAADAAVAGEGELSFERILEAHLGGSDFSGIPGLMWRSKEGEILTNPGTPPVVTDLDSLPLPAYDLIDVKAYWKLQSMPPVPRRKYISLLSSRGCPYQCMWCHDVFGKSFRARSAERIVDEIEYYVKTYGVNDVEFLDDIFNLEPRRVITFAEEMHRRNIRVKIAFPNGVRSDLLAEDTIDALVSAGTYFCSFALESGSPRVQTFSGKRLNIPRFLKSVELMAARRVFCNGFMMLGFPTETEAEMQETINVASNSMLHTASFFTVTPFPNTQIHAYVREHHPEKLEKLSFWDMDFCRIPVNVSDVTDETLFYYQRKAQRQFFLQPGRMFRLVRDFPQPHLLPLYVPIFISRMVKGFSRKTDTP